MGIFYGLDKEGRNRIRAMVKAGATGEEVRAEIWRIKKVNCTMSGEYEFDHSKNEGFVEELMESGYPKTATYLGRINDWNLGSQRISSGPSAWELAEMERTPSSPLGRYLKERHHRIF